MPVEPVISIWGTPVLPLFVVINTTPFAPREPYIAVADASFKISIPAMSVGLIKLSGLPPSLPKSPPLPPGLAEPPDKGTPSTTKSG